MRLSPRLLVVALVFLQTQTPGGAFGGVSSDPLLVLDQERTLSTMVIVPPCEQPNSEFANDSADDFELFTSLIESIRTCKNATGVALAQQSSEFGAAGMTATGMVYATASSEVNTIIHAIPNSHFQSTFQVTASHAFEIVGTLTAAGPAPVVLSHAQVRLTDSQSAVVFEALVEPTQTGDEVSIDVEGTGELAPGTYTLRVDALAVIDSTVPPNGTGYAFYDIEFRIIVPGDLNQDGVVDSDDQASFCAAIGSAKGDPAFDAAADLNDDDVIDEIDQQLFNEILPPCAGDVVSSATFQPPADGVTDAADLAFLLGAWGAQPSCADFVASRTFAPPPDGVVDAADLAFLLGAWGDCE